jgi:hypothetical protein
MTGQAPAAGAACDKQEREIRDFRVRETTNYLPGRLFLLQQKGNVVQHGKCATRLFQTLISISPNMINNPIKCATMNRPRLTMNRTASVGSFARSNRFQELPMNFRSA